jgi:hypothetical protein
MNTNATKMIGERKLEVAPPLQIVLTCDHPLVAEAARKLLDRFLAKWAGDVDVHRDEWSFAELEHPQCHSEALELARHCDIFVVALRGIEDLPLSFVEWLSAWFESREKVEAALIVLVAANGANLARLPRCAGLPIAAQTHGLSFFTTSVVLPGSNYLPPINSKAWIARLGAIDPDLLPDFSGINE